MAERIGNISKFFFCIILTIFFLCPSLHAADKIQTVGGVLQVQEVGYVKKLIFRGKVIPKIENDIVDIDSIYRIGQNDVVLVSEDCGGTMCGVGSYTFITIKPDGTYKLSSYFSLKGGCVTKQIGDIIIIKCQDHLKYLTITYDGGRIKKKEEMAPEASGKVSEADCRGVYQLYTGLCLQLKQCSSEDFSHVDSKNYIYYSEDKRIKMSVFDDLCKKACSGTESFQYNQFSNQVCGR